MKVVVDDDEEGDNSVDGRRIATSTVTTVMARVITAVTAGAQEVVSAGVDGSRTVAEMSRIQPSVQVNEPRSGTAARRRAGMGWVVEERRGGEGWKDRKSCMYVLHHSIIIFFFIYFSVYIYIYWCVCVCEIGYSIIENNKTRENVESREYVTAIFIFFLFTDGVNR